MSYAVEIAETIFAQIGGRGFAMMVGMKNPYLYSHNDLTDNVTATFFFRAKAKNGANYIQITYNRGMDDYNMTFGYKGRKDVREIETIESLYAEDLARIFKDKTGLDVVPPRFVCG